MELRGQTHLVWQSEPQYATSRHPLQTLRRWAALNTLQAHPAQPHLSNGVKTEGL